MTPYTAFGFGFFLGWLASWVLFMVVVKWARANHRPPPTEWDTPIRTAQLDQLFRVLYGRERDAAAKRRMH